MKTTRTFRFDRLASAVVVGVVLVAAGASPVAGQAPADTPPISPNPIVIAGQLRAALLLERQALAKVSEGGGAPEIVPPAERAYVLIRAAREGMIQAQAKSKFKDPLLDYQISRTTTAWNLARWPVDASFNAMSTESYVRGSGEHLTEVVQLLEEVLLVLP